jgi:hypothetical protein
VTQTVTRLASDGSDTVLDWNAITLQAIRYDRTAPTFAAYNTALVHTAIYDAVNAIDRSHQVYQVDTAATNASMEAAVASAAHQILVALYPYQTTIFDAQLLASLAEVPDGAAETAGVTLGEFVANQTLSARQNDGSTDVVAYTPGTDPGDWQPTLNNLTGNYDGALLPQWGKVKTFGISSGSQFRPNGPTTLTSDQYTADFNQKMGFAFVCPISNTRRKNSFYVPIPEGETITGGLCVTNCDRLILEPGKLVLRVNAQTYCYKMCSEDLSQLFFKEF